MKEEIENYGIKRDQEHAAKKGRKMTNEYKEQRKAMIMRNRRR